MQGHFEPSSNELAHLTCFARQWMMERSLSCLALTLTIYLAARLARLTRQWM